MDIITISSDSDTSINDYINHKSSSPNKSVGNYYVDWNDDGDVQPAIDYNFESTDKKDHQLSIPDIEEFKTPVKSPLTSIHRDVEEENNFPLDNDSTKTRHISPVKGGLSSASDSESCSQSSKSPFGKRKLRQKLSQEEKQIAKLAKEQRKLEKEKVREGKRAEQLKQKALKAAHFEKQRNLKPEENIKFLKVHIDNNVINSSYGVNVISVLQQNNIQYVVESQRKECTVIWSKKKLEKVINDFGEVTEKMEIKEENILLYVINWELAVELIHRNELLSHIETVKSVYSKKKLTLIIYGLGKYFSYKKNKELNDKKRGKGKGSERMFEEAHSISGNQLEFALTELQLIGQHNCRLLETPEEFSSLIYNLTKSLSQIEFKLERQKRFNNEIGWVAVDSANQSVKVDKNGNGLLLLWQRQLCQFSSVGLETAQAVVNQYNSPLSLINDYEKCESINDKELLLQNIQIRRNAGIVSTSRRVGPQLSKKIYKFFTSNDPDLEL